MSDWLQRETLPSPQHDLARPRGWLLMAAVGLILGAMGEWSWHSRQLTGWLTGLGACTVLVLIALDLRLHLLGHRSDDSVE
jgi:fatty acid desaturase